MPKVGRSPAGRVKALHLVKIRTRHWIPAYAGMASEQPTRSVREWNKTRPTPSRGGPTRASFGDSARLHPAIDEVRLGVAVDDGIVDHDLADVFERRQFVHRVEQHLFEDRAQAARTGLALEGLACDCAERFIAEL